jgi:hypothetical protein
LLGTVRARDLFLKILGQKGQERVKKLVFEAKPAVCSGKAARSAAIPSPVFIPF